MSRLKRLGLVLLGTLLVLFALIGVLTVTRGTPVRVVVVDGRVGYTGGFGLADYWLGDGRHDGQWRETNVRFEGPAVMQLQAAFAAAWAEAKGELLTGDVFFPRGTFRASP